MSLNQYTSHDLYGHLAFELYTDISNSGKIHNVPTKDVSFIRFTSNSAVEITGLDPGYSNSNNKILVVAYTGINSLTILHSASGSNPVNRVQCPLASNVTLLQNESVTLIYDSDSSFWRFASGIGIKEHDLLLNKDGGDGISKFYHSDQPINTTDNVKFNSVNINEISTILAGSIKPNSGSGVTALTGAVYIRSDGTLWNKVDSSDTAWRCLWIGNLTGESTGFPVQSNGEIDRTSSGISFSNVTRQFSISPTGGNSTYSIVIKGREFVKSTTESVTIPNTTGNYYIYFNESGTLTYTTTFTLEIIYKFVYVASVYWNATQGKAINFGDERHGCTMDAHTHARIHQRDGAVFVSGSALNNFNINGDGTNNNQTQYSIGSGFIRDEDILHTLRSISQTESVPVLYRVGTEWYSVENANQKFHYNTRAYYNLNTAGSYSLAEIPDTQCCLYHVVATNDVNNPYLILMGMNSYLNANKAREGAITEISQYSGLPFVEFVFVATVIYQSNNTYTNTGKSRIISTDTGANYVDWRFATTLNPNTAGVNTHNSLGGIQGGLGGDFYHSNQPINTTDSPTFAGLTLGNLQYPSTDGTNGQSIVTDGAGNLTFQTVSGGGGGGTAGLTYQITNTPPTSLRVGMPVYWNGTNYAPANASTNTKIPTAVVKEINVGNYTVQFGGVLTLTNVQWGLITGASGVSGLTTSASTNVYYLSDVNDGQITNVSPIFSIPVLNCVKNDGTNSTVEIKFGQLSSTLTNESYSREREAFIANGSTFTFTLTLTPYSRNTTMVTIDGVVQQTNSFSISNKNIIFSEAPPLNSEIEVNYVVQKNLSYANIVKHVETTTVSKTAFTLPVTPASESEVMAWVGGSYQDNSNFTLSGNVLTFDTNVNLGVKVQFVIFTSIQFADFPYIKRKSLTISNNTTKTLIDGFANQSSGRYDFHVVSNPLIGGTIRLQESNPVNVRVETFSTDINSTQGTNNKLNIYLNGSGNLEFQNLLGSSITIMLERHQ